MAEPTINYPGSLDTDKTLLSFVNNFSTTLAADTNTAATTVRLSNASRLPDSGYITVPDITDVNGTWEIIHYDHKGILADGENANWLYGCTRGADGTSATSHDNGANVYLYIIASHHEQLKDAIIAVEEWLNNAYTKINNVSSGLASDVSNLITKINNVSQARIDNDANLFTKINNVSAFCDSDIFNVSTRNVSGDGMYWVNLDISSLQGTPNYPIFYMYESAGGTTWQGGNVIPTLWDSTNPNNAWFSFFDPISCRAKVLR